jgi:HEAT repeat protein
MGDASDADALTAALGDADRRVRARAAWALGSVEPRRAPPALVALLGDGEPSVRLLAAWALFSIEDPATAPALDRALRAERDPKLQRAYVRALAALGDQSVPAIRALLDSADPTVRAVAVRALAGGGATDPWPWPWPQPRPSP